LTTAPTNAEVRRILREASCLRCARLPICAVYRGAQQVLAMFPEDPEQEGTRVAAPFRADDAAKICAYFAPPSVMP